MSLSSYLQYFLAIVAAAFGIRLIYLEFSQELCGGFGIKRQRADVRRVFDQLQEIEELFGAGMLPTRDHWDRLRELPSPWGTLAHESLQELRSSGGAVLPTVRRLKELASNQLRALADAKARSSQALAQALACAALIPLMGGVLYVLLPGVSDSPWIWTGLCFVSLLIAGCGALWLLSMAQAARWAGLPRSGRNWILASQCAGERFLALVRAGTPADLAWTRSIDLLSRESPTLALAWGHSIWIVPSPDAAPSDPASRFFVEAGDSLRKAVHVSLMEGRPCSERVEAALLSLSHEIKARVEAELTLLSTRALKPLFLCVAPGIFLLLGVGFFLCFTHTVSGGF